MIKRFLNPTKMVLTLIAGFISALSLLNHLVRFWGRSLNTQIAILCVAALIVGGVFHIIVWIILYPNLQQRKKTLFTASIITLVSMSILVIDVIPEFTPFPPRWHTLEIKTTGKENASAQGAEIAVLEIRKPGEEVIPLDQFEQTGQWDLKPAGIPMLIANNNGQTATLKTKFLANANEEISLLFSSDPQSGIVDISLDEQKITVDLFSSSKNDQIIILKTTPNPFWKYILYTADILAITLLICFIIAAMLGSLEKSPTAIIQERSLMTGLVALPLILLVGIAIPKPADAFGQTRVAEERFYVQKTHGLQKYDMVLLGNSRTLSALSPAVMQETLQNCRVLNFGYPRGALGPVIYQAAEKRLDANSQNKAVVLGISPSSLTINENELYLQEANRSADYIFTHLYMTPFLEILQPIDGEVDSNIRKNFYDDGWRPTWWVLEDPTYAMAEYRQEFSKNQVDPALEQQLFEQTKLWRSQGIAVFSFRVPVPQEMVDIENQIGGFNEAEFASKFEAAGGIWFKIPIEPYHSYDGNHLIKESAVELSNNLAKQIGEYYHCK